MSIIYEALKKVENSLDKKNIGPAGKNMKNKNYFLYFAVSAVGAACVAFIFGFFVFKNKQETALDKGYVAPAAVSVIPQAPAAFVEQAAPAATIEIKEPAPKKSFTPPRFNVNGIFFSEEKGYALINNRIVEKGDNIEGFKVISISLESIGLENEEGEQFSLKAVN
ncbi:MAG: hypothetical protein JW788_03740 [Candidatus Omnitrophica bacterium]|nr:hypothetical protein [Candidatus Omnitrophota bacterium]